MKPGDGSRARAGEGWEVLARSWAVGSGTAGWAPGRWTDRGTAWELGTVPEAGRGRLGFRDCGKGRGTGGLASPRHTGQGDQNRSPN